MQDCYYDNMVITKSNYKLPKREKKEIIMDKNKIISMLNKKIPKLGVSAASKEISKKTLLKRDNIYKLALEIKNVNKKND